MASAALPAILRQKTRATAIHRLLAAIRRTALMLCVQSAYLYVQSIN